MNGRAIIRVLLFLGLFLGFTPSNGYSQHPIDVQRFAAKSDFLKALATYDKMPKRALTTDATLAAARSAWALGLTDRAIEEFERASRDEKLDPVEKGKIFLSRGVIEFQEGRYQVAALYAERSISTLKEVSALRSRSWLLWAESLSKLGSYGAAEERYIRALEEASAEDQSEINFLLGACRMKLGRGEAARENFERVPMEHERTPMAIRYLAEIALSAGRYADVSLWLENGLKHYPDQFLDSWVDYARLTAAVQAKDGALVRSIRDESAKKYPPSDYWFTLLDAAGEAYQREEKSISGGGA